MCNEECLKNMIQDWKFTIPLIVYASLTTVATFVLGLWVYQLRKRTNYVECSDASDDSVRNCTERVSNMCYEIEDITIEKSMLRRTHSTPLEPSRPKVESIYDGITSTSVSQKKTKESFSKKYIDACASYSHENDDIGTVFGHQYETILEQVANTLTDVYKDNSRIQDVDIYNTFLKELITKIKDIGSEIEDIPPEATTLRKTHSTPLKSRRPNVESIYDGITSTSVSHKKNNESSSKKNIDICAIHAHEDDGTVFSHQYETILDQTANTLTNVHKGNSRMQAVDICNYFMTQLKRKIKEKDAKMYDSIQNYTVISKHVYEVIGEKVRPQSTETEFDSDDTYAEYLGPSKKHRSYILEGNSETSSSFGSADHLKYFKEEKDDVRISASTPYLSPKSFRPKSNCPENLRSLWQQNIKQKNIEGKFSKLYVPNNKNEKDQVEVSPENYVERAYLTVIPISEESSTQSVKEQYFETFSVKNEKEKKSPPPVPPKKFRIRTISSEDEKLL
jgi:uncharacterized protein YoxC